MNANELADAMQGVISVLNVHHEEDCLFIANEAQYMLRQQQAEIATLKHMNKNWQISENILLLELEKLQHRELTDEEILQVMINVYSDTVPPIRGVEFARAILRKAQEK